MMTSFQKAQRLDRITEIYQWVYENVESFNCDYANGSDSIGVDLAYLLGAIAKGSHVTWFSDDSIVMLLRDEALTPPAWVWDYVRVYDEEDEE